MNTHPRRHSFAARAVLVTLFFLLPRTPSQAPSWEVAPAYAAVPAADPPPGPPGGPAVPGAPEPASATPATPGAPAATPAAPTGAADLNFDLLDEGKKPDAGPSPEELKRRAAIERGARIRRPMLTAHQALGFATLAALTATVVIGHLNYYDKYQSGDFSGRYSLAHEGLGIGTSILFGATGLLAVFAPNPYPKPIRLDTALIHKISMILATAGMVTQVILGPVTANRVGRLDQGSLALAHVVTGYATWAFMATGTFVYFF